MKNPNGFGTVYKLSKKGRRKPWVARVTTGWTPEGKQTKQTIGYFEEKIDGLDALVMHRINPVSPKANITLKELYEEWSLSKFEKISKPTIDNYKAGWKYLAKYANVKFKELRTGQFQVVIDQCHRNKMSRSTMEKIKSLASMLYEYAMQNDIINKNYAEFIELPKTNKEEKEIFTEIERHVLEKHVDIVEWVDVILIFIYSGLRPSELFGLTRFNVDIDNMLFKGGIKTEAGKNRVVPIHPKIQKHVKKWYDKNGNYLIFGPLGGQLSANNFRQRQFYPILERLKIRKLNPYCCRHTFASMLKEAGVDNRYIQEMLGHTKYSFTEDTYIHVDIEARRNAINKI